jgi:hypothetical protein
LLRIAKRGLQAIQVEDEATEPDKPTKKPPAQSVKSRKAATATNDSPKSQQAGPARPRADSKQANVIAMLNRPPSYGAWTPGQEKLLPANRGAALWGNLVVSVANYPARVIASNKETGKVVWETNMGDGQPDLQLTAAPLAIKPASETDYKTWTEAPASCGPKDNVTGF